VGWVCQTPSPINTGNSDRNPDIDINEGYLPQDSSAIGCTSTDTESDEESNDGGHLQQQEETRPPLMPMLILNEPKTKLDGSSSSMDPNGHEARKKRKMNPKTPQNH
jgi:hypothetical protein